MSTVKIGGRPSTETAGAPKIEDIKSTSGALHVNDAGAALNKTALTASGQVGATGARTYRGCIVTTALSAAAVTLYDNTSGAGTVIDVIPASSAAGYRSDPPANIPCTNGIYASFGGTGTILFLYD